MNIEKQINRKVKDNKASIIVNLFAIIPVYFLGVVFFTTLLMSTSEIEHICNRLEPNHVECYPGTLLVDWILRLRRPGYILKSAVIEQPVKSINYDFYFITNQSKKLRPRYYSELKLFVAQDKLDAINNFITGVDSNKDLVLYTKFTRNYLLTYILLIILIWSVFLIYIWQTIRKVIFIFK